MKSIILAAGRPHYSHSNLSVSEAPVLDYRLIDMQAAALSSMGFGQIAVVRGHGAGKALRADITEYMNEDWETSGSIESLRAALEWLDGEQDVLISYGDSLYSLEVLDALRHSTGAISSVCYLDRHGSDVSRFHEYAVIDNGRLTEVRQDDPGHGVRSVLTGLVLVRGERVGALRSYLKERLYPRDGHLGDLINSMISHGVDITPVLVEHGWTEVDTKEGLSADQIEARFLSDLLPIHVDWGSRSKQYDKLDWVNNDDLLASMIDVVTDGAPKRLLDVGTGTGKVLRASYSKLGAGEFWGVDSSEDMLARIESFPGLTLKVDDAHRMASLPDNYFDVISARMVFHHIERIGEAMASMVRVLRPGGHVVVCEGVPPSLRTVSWYTDMFRYKEDRRTLTEVDLIEMLVSASLTNVTTRTVVMRASLNNWLDNSGIPDENIRKIKELHYAAPDYVKDDYEMIEEGGDCMMTWRFAISSGLLPDRSE